MSADDRDLHPNLADALSGDAPDAGPLPTQGELGELDRLARQLAELDEDRAPDGPPPVDLWARIEAEAFADAPPDSVERPAPATTGSPASAPIDTAPAVAELRPRRRRLALAALAAAAVVVVVVGFVATGDDDEPITEQVVLEPLPGFDDAAGTATLVLDGEQRTVTVDLEGTEVPADHHLELWLLDEEVTEIIPLGAIEGGEHSIPAEVDLGTTPVVDVSLEPDDGDPAHSGVSIVRGVVES